MMTRNRAFAICAALLWATALGGCGEDEAPASAERGADEGQGGGGAPAEPEGPPGPLAEDPTFELRATASGPYAAGEEGTFEVRLTPRGEYHVNQEFPMAVAVSGPDGLTVPGEELSNEDAAEFSEQVARFEVPFTATGAGEHTVTCEVDFAVCTPEACMPDHRTLALVLPVR